IRDVEDGKSDVGHGHAISDVSGLESALEGKASTSHTHDDRYYTETETDSLLSAKSDNDHTHAIEDVAGLQDAIAAAGTGYTEEEADDLLDAKADKVTGGEEGHIVVLDGDGNLADSGSSVADLTVLADKNYIHEQLASSDAW